MEKLADELIKQVFAQHVHDHTATPMIKDCQNPLCQLAYAADHELGRLDAELERLRAIAKAARKTVRTHGMRHKNKSEYYYAVSADRLEELETLLGLK